MSLNFIVNPVTLESHSIFSKQGVALLKNYVKDYQTGGALANNTLPKQFRFEGNLFEIKDGNKYASQQKLTVAEQDFCDNWKGQYHVITCLDDAIKIINSTD